MVPHSDLLPLYLRCCYQLGRAGGDLVRAHHQLLELALALHHLICGITADKTLPVTHVLEYSSDQTTALVVAYVFLHQHGGAPTYGLGGRNKTFGPSGVFGVELLHRRSPLWTHTNFYDITDSQTFFWFPKSVSSLTLPLSTMSLCRSLEESTSTLMACIRSVQDANILQGATNSNI